MQYSLIITLIISIIVTYLWSLTYKISISKTKFLKKTSLWVCGSFDIEKSTYLDMVRGLYYLVFGAIVNLVFVKYYNLQLAQLGKEFTFAYFLKGLAVMILVLIMLVELSSAVSLLIIMLLIKGDLRRAITDIQWLSFNPKHPMYTAIIRPLAVVIIEMIFYYGILFRVLTAQYGINFILSIIICSAIFSFGKLFIAKNKEQAVAFVCWHFFTALGCGLVLGFTGSLILPMLTYYLSASFWAFKK